MRILKFLPIILLSIIFILLGIVPLFVANIFGIKPSPTEFSISVTGVVFSALSFVGILVTIWFQIESSRQQQEEINRNFTLERDNYNQHLLHHIETLFLGDSFQECRNRVWEFWTDLNTDDKAAGEIEKIFRLSMHRFWCDNREQAKELFATERFRDFREIIRFVRYFDVISRFSFDKVTINAIQFYYVYYREFFVFITDLYKRAYSDEVNIYNKETASESINQTMQGWHDIVCRMDEIMAEFNLPVSNGQPAMQV